MKTQDPPLVDLKVTNPVTYIKIWWKRIIGNEGMEFRLKIKPLTAIVIAIVVFGINIGLGGIVFTGKASPTPTPTTAPTQDVWRETALTGTLTFTPNTNKYFLVTQATEAVTLEFEETIDLSAYRGRRILASGLYNQRGRVLKIADILDLEILPARPTTIPTPTITETPIPQPTQVLQ